MKQIEPKVDVVYDYKHEGNDNTVATVWVRVYLSRTRRKYISTGVRVYPYQWSELYHVVRHEDAVVLNRMIDEQLQKCRHMAEMSMRGVDVDSKAMKVDRSASSFLDYIKEKISTSSHLNPTTLRQRRSMLNCLERYGRIRRFEDVTQSKLKEYIAYLQKSGISQTTVHSQWKKLRVYVKMAIDEGFVVSNISLKVPVGNYKEREHLTDEEIERWRNVDLKHQYLKDARDRFIVQMATGLRYGDLVEVDFSRHEIVDDLMVMSGVTKKTQKQYFLVILPMAWDILERWNWRVPKISNSDYNAYLHTIAACANINKNITSHVGRHTYACQCLAHGVRIEAVQRTLGHTKIQTTQIYARMMDQDVINAFKNMK